MVLEGYGRLSGEFGVYQRLPLLQPKSRQVAENLVFRALPNS